MVNTPGDPCIIWAGGGKPTFRRFMLNKRCRARHLLVLISFNTGSESVSSSFSEDSRDDVRLRCWMEVLKRSPAGRRAAGG